MPAYQGAYYAKSIALKLKSDSSPINITGWTFRAMLRTRDAPIEDLPLLELTSANGGFAILNAAAGRFSMIITALQTLTLPEGVILFDVMRTDIVPGPVFQFEGQLTVKKPETRDPTP